MNILIANWSWFQSGGDWTYIDNICKLYEANGHKIIPFSVKNDKNYETPYKQYFIENANYNSYYKKLSIIESIKLLSKAIYSKEAQIKLQNLLAEVNVDIAQLNSINNYHTPSIIPVLKKAKIPIVWRILDYKLICPNTTLYSHGQICESCHKHKYYNCAIKRCKKNSFLASSLMAIESYYYYLYPLYKEVDMFLFQSEFTRDMFVKFGFEMSRTQIIPNPFDCSNIKSSTHSKRYILYFGRLEKEKGIYTLINAMKRISDIELKVVGVGNEFEKLNRYVKDNEITNVSLLGSKWDKELVPIIEDCEFVIVPSEWYEPSPYVAFQSFSYGKPVIASNIGGLKNIIVDHENGLFFEAGNEENLSIAIRTLFGNKELIEKMGKSARLLVETKYSPEQYYASTMKIFNELIKN